MATRREILVFTEGQKTEGGYLLPWRRQHRRSVLVTVDPFHGTPRSLVDRAVQTKQREAREEKRGRGRSHDEIWCVFDIDDHPHISDAIAEAEANGICLAVSNPCIELWFILHFEDRTAYLDRQAAQSRSSSLLKCGKTLTCEATDILYRTFVPAMNRAIALDRKHDGDGSPVGANPSSGVWTLIESIRR